MSRIGSKKVHNMWNESSLFFVPKFLRPRFVGEGDGGSSGSSGGGGKTGGEGGQGGSGGHGGEGSKGGGQQAPAFTKEDVARMVSEEAGKVVSSAMDKLMKDLPGMTKRHAADISKELVASSMEEFKKTHAASQQDQSRVKALEDELAVMKDTSARKEKTNIILNKVGALKIQKSAREWVVADIAQRVKINDQGEYYMIIKEKLAETGKVVDKEVSIEDGIADYFLTRQDLLIADVQGGSGARNSNNQGGNAATSYQQLLDNPAMMTDYLKHKPDEVARMRTEHDKERKKKV